MAEQDRLLAWLLAFTTEWHLHSVGATPTMSSDLLCVPDAALGPARLELLAAVAVRDGLLAWLLAFQDRLADAAHGKLPAGLSSSSEVRAVEGICSV